MITGYRWNMYKTVNWKTGPARARYNLELKKNIKSKKPQAASSKRQAASSRRLKKDTILKEAIETMGLSNLGIISVVDNNDTLLGVITDGDLRRKLLKYLKNINLQEYIALTDKLKIRK